MTVLAHAPAPTLAGRDLLSIDQLSAAELAELLDLADRLKALQACGADHRLLPGRTLAMIFQKPSTRTRVSFEVGIAQLGGVAVNLSASEMQLGRGESVEDTGLVLSRYVDAIMIRTGAHESVERLAGAASVPVINGLSDLHHPCQALADLQTLRERLGPLAGRSLAWVGDGCNNVCHSLISAAGALGMRVTVASPLGFEPDAEVVAAAGDVRVVEDPREAVRAADAVATDVWTSMGQEAEREQRIAIRPATRSTGGCWPRRRRSTWCCTACRPTTARRSPTTCCTGRARPPGTRPRTGCTPRRRCWRW